MSHKDQDQDLTLKDKDFFYCPFNSILMPNCLAPVYSSLASLQIHI